MHLSLLGLKLSDTHTLLYTLTGKLLKSLIILLQASLHFSLENKAETNEKKITA